MLPQAIHHFTRIAFFPVEAYCRRASRCSFILLLYFYFFMILVEGQDAV